MRRTEAGIVYDMRKQPFRLKATHLIDDARAGNAGWALIQRVASGSMTRQLVISFCSST